jgi:hypothetical protein
MTSVASLFFAASLVGAPAEPEAMPVPDEVVEQMQYFVGEWRAEGDATDRRLRGTWTARWEPGKHCLIVHYKGTIGETAFDATEMIGWNSASGGLKLLSFFSHGVFEDIDYSLTSPGKYEGTYKGTAWGESFSAKCAVAIQGPNRWEFSTKGLKRGGEHRPDISVRFTRKAASSKSKRAKVKKRQSTVEEFQEYCQLVQGRWLNMDETLATEWFEFSDKNKKAVSHGEIRLVADGRALEGVWYGGKGTAKWLTTWDASSKQIRKFAVLSDGTVWDEIRFKQGDNKWGCLVTLNRPDGTTEKVVSTLTISEDGATHTYTSAGDDRPGVYKRVSN